MNIALEAVDLSFVVDFFWEDYRFEKMGSGEIQFDFVDWHEQFFHPLKKCFLKLRDGGVTEV